MYDTLAWIDLLISWVASFGRLGHRRARSRRHYAGFAAEINLR